MRIKLSSKISPSNHPSFRAEHSEVEKSFKDAYKTKYKDFSTAVKRTNFLLKFNVMELGGCIYIMTNYQRTTLYIGVTSNLRSRIYEHQNKIHPTSFTAKYNLTLCVYYEVYTSIEEAIDREKQLKKWTRAKKETLIDNFNNSWDDLTRIIDKWED